MRKIQLNMGFSMIEVLIILIAIPVFAIISTQSLINVLSSQRKVDAEVRVRGNIEHIFSYIERRILNARDLSVTGSSELIYMNINGVEGRFVCIGSFGGGTISHEEIVGEDPVQLNDSDIDIFNCQIQEIPVVAGAPQGVRLVLGGRIVGMDGDEGGQIELSTIVHTRSY